VLHGLSFNIRSGERVGVVGRTGSGKVCRITCSSHERHTEILQSSLTLALLQCILTEGVVYFDGLETNTVNLDSLRSSITIIPQTVRTFPIPPSLTAKPDRLSA
jgi:ABC-type multidrug transport system fused ATPase/permease subunit